MTNLGAMKPRQSGKIVSFTVDAPQVSRLLAMGVVPGSTVNVVGVAPLGDPMMVDVNGCRMSLRRREAAALNVETSESPA